MPCSHSSTEPRAGRDCVQHWLRVRQAAALTLRAQLCCKRALSSAVPQGCASRTHQAAVLSSSRRCLTRGPDELLRQHSRSYVCLYTQRGRASTPVAYLGRGGLLHVRWRAGAVTLALCAHFQRRALPHTTVDVS